MSNHSEMDRNRKQMQNMGFKGSARSERFCCNHVSIRSQSRRFKGTKQSVLQLLKNHINNVLCAVTNKPSSSVEKYTILVI